MAWFRKRLAVEERPFRPEDLTYPFAFPVVVLHDTEASGFLTPQQFGLASESTARNGTVPESEIFTNALECWKPVGVRAVCNTGRRVFGRSVYYAEFDYALERRYELAELSERIIASVKADPDDVWNQVMDHDEIIRAIREATSFDDVVDALRAAGAAS